MFRNYLVTALRNLSRHRLYSFINIAGLAMGLACVVFIILFIRDELSFDKWVPDSSNLYRVDVGTQLPGRPMDHFALAPFPLPVFMKDHLPEITEATHLWPGSMTVQVGNRQFYDDINEADANFFTVMKLPLVVGDPGKVLQKPESIVLTEALAKKYFGNADPIGRQVVMNRSNCGKELISCPEGAVSLTVTGVMRDLPHNTQFQLGAVIPVTSPVDQITDAGKKAWFWFNGYGYVRLMPGTDPAQVTAKLLGLMDRLIDLSPNIGVHKPTSQTMTVNLVPFQDVHMTAVDGDRVPPGSWTTLYGLGLIGLMILLAACFNFTNLATVRAMMRAREIGLRKCVGASRRQVAMQFLSESILIALVSLIFALAAVEILLPSYDGFLNRPIRLNYLHDVPLLLIILTIATGAGLISGLYPALVLSGFRPASVLRSSQSGQAGSGTFRTTLVVLQFTVSITLAIATLVVFAQIDYSRKQELGFKRNGIVVVETMRRMTPAARESFMALLRAYPGIAGVASSSDTPFSSNSSIDSVQVPGQPGSFTTEELLVTPEFLNLYGIKLVAGRALSDARAADAINKSAPDNSAHNILINETAARHFGFSAQGALGKTIYVNKHAARIVGILNDVYFKGARRVVQATVYLNDKIDASIVSVRLTGRDIPSTIAFIDRTWSRMAPSTAISRTFLDDRFEKLYRSDEQQGQMFGTFVAIAILIACLGLFGLAAFTAGRRTKEIGIRKAFGARDRDVVFLLLWQFSVPVLIANLIAWPLAWYYLHGWLQGFATRISLSPTYFLAAGFAALLIAWATILSHALRVARANPIHALRIE
jgi:putative ABC transport system permease protein